MPKRCSPIRRRSVSAVKRRLEGGGGWGGIDIPSPATGDRSGFDALGRRFLAGHPDDERQRIRESHRYGCGNNGRHLGGGRPLRARDAVPVRREVERILVERGTGRGCERTRRL